MSGAFACGTAAGITRIGEFGIGEDKVKYDNPGATQFIRNLYENLMAVRKGKVDPSCQRVVDKYVTIIKPNSQVA